jgi:hypothetical protein
LASFERGCSHLPNESPLGYNATHQSKIPGARNKVWKANKKKRGSRDSMGWGDGFISKLVVLITCRPSRQQ